MKQYCCEEMKKQLEFTCEAHADLCDCSEAIILYVEKYDEYGIYIHDVARTFLVIFYCPWCGTRLPESKRGLWFKTLKEMGVNEPYYDDIPKRFHSAQWYKGNGEDDHKAMPIDLLDKLCKSEVTPEEAEQILKEMIVVGEGSPWWKLIGMTDFEAVAHAKGVGFERLAEWRHKGENVQCACCGKDIDLLNSVWQMQTKGQITKIVHSECVQENFKVWTTIEHNLYE